VGKYANEFEKVIHKKAAKISECACKLSLDKMRSNLFVLGLVKGLLSLLLFRVHFLLRLVLGCRCVLHSILPAILLTIYDELAAGLLEATRVVAVVILFSWVEWLHPFVALKLLEEFPLAFSGLQEDVLDLV